MELCLLRPGILPLLPESMVYAPFMQIDILILYHVNILCQLAFFVVQRRKLWYTSAIKEVSDYAEFFCFETGG